MTTDLAQTLADGFAPVVDERFDQPSLDRSLWLPHHLPQWSSRAQSAARHELGDVGLELRVEPDQPPWCPEFDATTRVSSLQTGVRSGPVGSTDGQHRFADGVVVREEQPTAWLHTPHHGAVVLRARAELHDQSMAALWLVGVEDEPHRCGVIDVMEVFGRDATAATARVGMNLKPFTDPMLTEDLAAPELAIDVRETHEYAVVWTGEGVAWFVDGEEVRRVEQSPDYPMQLMLGVYSFEPPAPDAFVPRFVVASLRTHAREP